MARIANISVPRLGLGVPASNLTFFSGETKYFTLILPHDPIARVVDITVVGDVHMCVKRGQLASYVTKDYVGKEIHIYGPPFGKHIINVCKEAFAISDVHNCKQNSLAYNLFYNIRKKSASLVWQFSFHKSIISR